MTGHVVRTIRAGFTLAEVLLSVFILTLVIFAVHFSLMTTLDAFHAGSQSIEQTQEMRVGLESVLSDMRQAASPNQFWQDTTERVVPVDADGRPLPVDPDIDPNRGKISFVGDGKQVTFVRKEIVPEREQPYDLVEITYQLNGEQKALQRMRGDSILEQQKVMWREAYLTLMHETEFHNMLPAPMQDPILENVLHNVLDVNFLYLDGQSGEWVSSWDSTEPLVEPDPYEEVDEWNQLLPTPTPDPSELRGLPGGVQIQLTYFADTHRRRGGVEQDALQRSMVTRTYLPHANLNLAETPFISKNQGRRGMRTGRTGRRGLGANRPDQIPGMGGL